VNKKDFEDFEQTDKYNRMSPAERKRVEDEKWERLTDSLYKAGDWE
jgi:hypothetical protein